MHQTVALTIRPTGRYLSRMPRGREPKGPRGPYPNRVTAVRKERGLTQQAIADAIGVVRNYVTRIEAGEFALSEDMTAKLCDALKAEPWEIDPDRFRLSVEDLEALLLNRDLLKEDPDRRRNWIGSGRDALIAAKKP
ncbi:MAG: helix-turn-helix transcriptional regulator [Alphaproteobacteria bacterium]